MNYAVWRNPQVVGASSVILSSHELGHALVAKAYGAHPSPPVFVPLGVVTLGMTRIRGMPKNGSHRSSVYLAGPVAGFSTSCMLLLGLLHSPWLLLGLVFTASEVYAYLLGSDAKKAKKARGHGAS